LRLLLDECLPRKLTADLAGHEVRTVSEMGWAGKDNGDLIALARDRFDGYWVSLHPTTMRFPPTTTHDRLFLPPLPE